MKRRSGLSSRPIEFMPRRFFFVITREISSCASTFTSNEQHAAFPSSKQALFPRTAGVQFISLHDQLPSRTNAPSSTSQLQDATDDDDEFTLDISHTLRFNGFLTRILTSATPSISLSPRATVEVSSTMHHFSPHYFFVRRERLQDVITAIHLICRWRLLYLGLTPHEAIGPFEHLPYLFSSFFAASARFDPPNLLGSLMGIAKGIASDLLVHAEMEPTIFGADCSGRRLVLLPVSQRFIIYFEADADAAKSIEDNNIEDDGVCVTERNDVQALIMRLKSCNASLFVAFRDRNNISSDDSETTADAMDITAGTKNNVATATNAWATHGLEFLDLSCDLACSEEDSSSSTSPDIPKSDEKIVARFLVACERTPGTIAVQGGLTTGRKISAATCIGCYLMKHHSFTSEEAIGWLRYCYPHQIPPDQQLLLDHMQESMWREGDAFRQQETTEAMEIEVTSLDDPMRCATTSMLHINIGRISLGRDSFLGTKDKGHESARQPVSSSPLTHDASSPRGPEASPSIMMSPGLKRRPFTQGSVGGRRLHRASDGVRTDFALLHKFVHQGAAPRRSLAVGSAFAAATARAASASQENATLARRADVST